ncbi:MAG: site-2 protease family protein [Candidatus Improbicoccus pseudotrichonymphae]|uniref:Site-2 protease family protein n=1 Tax=Candidatus Improbicoccus pseudotrichonymphae TaxID=3033792 RepID=A0AA48I506_9FIRM|nr:MAG: site-2 protease family protein [Candidatus Improbicoccus pseudotrichonymphae]
MFNFWFFRPGLDLLSISSRLTALIVIIVWFFPIHEIVHLWIYNLLNNRKSVFRNINFFELFDPVGSLCMILFNYGWARSIVPWSLIHSRKEKALIAIAGPIFNIVCSVAIGIIYNFFLLFCSFRVLNITWLFRFLSNLMEMNIRLGILNFIPVPPFDAFRVLELFVPRKYLSFFYRNYFLINVSLSFLFLFGFFDTFMMFLDNSIKNVVLMISSLPFIFFRNI